MPTAPPASSAHTRCGRDFPAWPRGRRAKPRSPGSRPAGSALASRHGDTGASGPWGSARAPPLPAATQAPGHRGRGVRECRGQRCTWSAAGRRSSLLVNSITAGKDNPQSAWACHEPTGRLLTAAMGPEALRGSRATPMGTARRRKGQCCCPQGPAPAGAAGEGVPMRTEAAARGRAHPECSQKPKLSAIGTGRSLQDTPRRRAPRGCRKPLRPRERSDRRGTRTDATEGLSPRA